MIDFLKRIFRRDPRKDLRQIVEDGAVIIDVRSRTEFNEGHVRGSVNIPLQSLASNLGKIEKGKPVIVCCASGIRSNSAKSILKSKGYKEVYNGGSWRNLQNTIN